LKFGVEIHIWFAVGGEYGDFLNAEGAKVSQRAQKEDKEYKRKKEEKEKEKEKRKYL
jgi:hypothetical protein